MIHAKERPPLWDTRTLAPASLLSLWSTFYTTLLYTDNIMQLQDFEIELMNRT